MKKVLLLGSLFLVACSNNTTPTTTQTTTTETTKALTVKEVLEKQQAVMNSLDSFKMTQNVTFYPSSNESAKQKTSVTSLMTQKPTLTMTNDVSMTYGSQTINTKQYYDGEFLYTAVNNQVQKMTLEQAGISLDMLQKNAAISNDYFIKIVEKGTVTTSDNETIILANTDNINKDALIAFFKTIMSQSSPTFKSQIDKFTYEIVKFNFKLTLEKDTLRSKSLDFNLTMKVSDDKSQETINLVIDAVIKDINKVEPTVVPQDVKEKAMTSSSKK